MSSIVTKEHKKASGELKNVLATYAEAEDLVNIGAYKPGSNKKISLMMKRKRMQSNRSLQKRNMGMIFYG